MKWLLDTNICIFLIKKRSAKVIARLEECIPGDVGISFITLAELQYGVEKSSRPESNREALQAFLIPLEIAFFDDAAAAAYGQLRAALESRGTPIGPLDMLIAAHALSLGCTLVTNNTKEFARVSALHLKDWSH